MLTSSLHSKEAKLAPDIVILNATIRTMDAKNPTASALAVLGNQIIAVGSTDEIRALTGKDTRVIDANKKLVLPGFNDSHVHFLMGGFSLSQVDLRDAKTPEEMANRLAAYAKTIPKGQWIRGGDWDHEKWPGTPLPTKEMIDAATPENPVFVNRTDGHMCLANSLAMKLSGVSKATKEVPGGEIVRDKNGEPTGIFKDGAEDLIKVPDHSESENLSAARAATAHAAKVGVTSVTDMSAGDDVGLYQTMAARGELKTRIYAIRSIVSGDVLQKAGVRAAFGGDMVRIGGLKGFADGSLGSTTAKFFEPYSDATNTSGLWYDQMLPEGTMEKRVLAADKHGLQVMIHAIGDQANSKILDIYREAVAQNGERDRRFKIEHAQHIRKEDILRFAKQKVIASMQPYHAADDGRWCDKRIGPERSKGTYAFRSLLDAGAVLAFGTDWTVAPLEPMISIKAAVTRQTLDGKHPDGWVPEQKISVEEAVHAYTVGSAYAEFAENRKGTLTPGKLADIVMLDRDIFSINPVEIENVKVNLTILDGRVVHEQK
ncbi:MAG: nfdA 3 [Verrucomicrobiales bacterium]|nr:nfdA 3 [Verrucomicrobiales bacterium]